MKNFRFLSSLALAGMLTTGVMGTSLAADTPTTPYGNFKADSLVASENVATFILNDSSDKVTVSDLQKNYELTSIDGKTTYAEDYEIKTGTIFQVEDGTQYKVVIWGDANKTGNITSADALEIQKYVFGNADLDPVQIEASDVDREVGATERKITSADALYVQKYVFGNVEKPINNPPEVPQEDEPTPSGYVVEGLVNADKEAVKCVNSKNLTTTNGDLKLKVSTPSAEEEKTVHVFVKVPQEDGTEKYVRLSANGGVTIADHQTQHFIDLIGDDHSTDTQNKSGLDELPGEGTFEVIITDDATGEELATTTIEIHKAKPVARDYTTKRSGSKTATMTLTGVRKEGGKVVEVNYRYKELPSGSYPADYTTLDLVNNKLENRQIASDLKDDPATAYDVEFYVVDEYGNESQKYTTTIVKDVAVAPEEAVSNITVPKLTSYTNTKYKWDVTDHTGNTYLVTLYKDGEVIDQKPAKIKTNTANFDLRPYIEEYGEGEYYISVVVKGNATGTSKDSEATTTEEELVTITKMNSVANVKFETTEEGTIITWDYPTLADDVKDKYSFDVVIEEWDPSGGNDRKGAYKSSSLTAATPAQDEDGNDLQNARKVSSSLTPNTLYKATVTVKPTTDYHYLESDPVSTAKDYFTLDANAIDSVATTTNTATITVDDTQLHFGNKENVTYGVIVYRQDDPDPDVHDATPGYRKLDPSKYTVTTNEDGEVVVSGLEADHNYKFLLTVDVDGDHGEMEYDDAVAGITKVEGISSLTNVEVKADKPEDGESTSNVIVKTSSGLDSVDGLYINGVQYEKGTNFDKYYPNELLNKAYAVLTDSNTPVVVGDKINSLTEDTVAITVADDEAQSTKDFSGTAFENMTIELTGDAYKTTVSHLATGAKLVVKKGYVDVSALSSNDVTLENGADVLTAADQIVNVSGTTTINKVDVISKGETSLKTTDTDSAFEVQVDTESASNSLTFNSQTGNGVQLTFTDVTAAQNAVYAGNVSITSKKGGAVSVTSAKGIKGSLTLDVDGGTAGSTVDISSPKLADVTKSVKLNGKITSLHVKAATKAPVALADVELRNYTLEEITEDTSDDTHLHAVVDEENYEAVMKYIKDFNLNSSNPAATFTTAAADSDDITIGGITLESQVTLGNIK